MDMTTLGSAGMKRGVTEGELLAAFADDTALGEAITLTNDDGSALVALGEGFGPYTLESYPSAERSGTHQRACDELKKSEVRDAMLDYLRGGSAWRDSYSWFEVEDQGRGDLGCLRAALALSLAAVPWVLITAGINFLVYAVAKTTLGIPEGSEALWGVPAWPA